MYTIGQVSEMFNLPISTLRYYDKEGLFPNMKRESGIRKFSDQEVDALHVIECLKKSGMEIKEIKQFMQWCAEGPATYEKRKNLFENRRKILEEEMKQLEKNKAMIEFKCWYYEQTLAGVSEQTLHDMIPGGLPEEIRHLYQLAHS